MTEIAQGGPNVQRFGRPHISLFAAFYRILEYPVLKVIKGGTRKIKMEI